MPSSTDCIWVVYPKCAKPSKPSPEARVSFSLNEGFFQRGNVFPGRYRCWSSIPDASDIFKDESFPIGGTNKTLSRIVADPGRKRRLIGKIARVNQSPEMAEFVNLGCQARNMSVLIPIGQNEYVTHRTLIVIVDAIETAPPIIGCLVAGSCRSFFIGRDRHRRDRDSEEKHPKRRSRLLLYPCKLRF
jgi:hypothetical protein